MPIPTGPGGPAPNQPIGQALAAGGGGMAAGPDPAMVQVAQQIQLILQAVMQLGQSNPVAAPKVEQIVNLLREIVVDTAQAQQAQTLSGMAVPGGGGAYGPPPTA